MKNKPAKKKPVAAARNADSKRIIATLYEELKRKDKIIAKLKEENLVLLKTALKAAEREKKQD